METDSFDNGNDNPSEINYDEFDREYALCELVPESFFNRMSEDIRPTGIIAILMDATGEICYPTGQVKNTWHKRFIAATKDKPRLGSQVISLAENEVLVPLTHQLEIIGYLFLEFNSEILRKSENFNSIIGTLVEKVLGQNIKSSYQNLLTSGLHTRVVNESFDEINKKTQLAEKSEEKYKLLSERLKEEVKIKAQEIKAAQAQLMHQEKLASIGQLAAGVAHEINNPMGFISSNLKTLKEYTEDLSGMIKGYQTCLAEITTEKANNEQLNSIRALEKELSIDYLLDDIPQLINESMEGAERVNKIVADLKDFAHPGEETPSFLDINTCINSTLNIVWNEIRYKAEIKKQLSDLPQIYCYPRQLNQVIMNMLINSSHAMEDKGEIIIKTSVAGEFVEIEISDNGSGIPEEFLSKIFDPFFTTKEVGKGTGLGLNLAYNIVCKHHGTIDVKSTLGEGTCFIIKLPVEADL